MIYPIFYHPQTPFRIRCLKAPKAVGSQLISLPKRLRSFSQMPASWESVGKVGGQSCHRKVRTAVVNIAVKHVWWRFTSSNPRPLMLCVFEMVQIYPLLDSMRPFEMMFHKMNLCSKQPAVGQTKTPSSVEIQRDTGRDTSHVPSPQKNRRHFHGIQTCRPNSSGKNLQVTSPRCQSKSSNKNHVAVL